MLGRVLGHYEIVGHLGGSMADVYLAFDRRLDRQVVLKILPSGQVNDAPRLSRLRREARLLSALNHPNVVTIHDVGEVGGRVFLTTEFVEGQSLRERLSHGPIPVCASGRDGAADRRGTRSRTRDRHPAPRRQARQRDGAPGRPGQGARLRNREGRRRREPRPRGGGRNRDGHDTGNPRIHVARADPRR